MQDKDSELSKHRFRWKKRRWQMQRSVLVRKEFSSFCFWNIRCKKYAIMLY